jgi:hypothetical protein
MALKSTELGIELAQDAPAIDTVARTSELGLEIAQDAPATDTTARTSELGLEVAAQVLGAARLTQLVVEVMQTNPGQPEAPLPVVLPPVPPIRRRVPTSFF